MDYASALAWGIQNRQQAPFREEALRNARLRNEEQEFGLNNQREQKRNDEAFNARLGEIVSANKYADAPEFWAAADKAPVNDEAQPGLQSETTIAGKPAQFADASGSRAPEAAGIRPAENRPVSLQELASDARARPLFKDPKALQAIADAAIQFKQASVPQWLNKRYMLEKEGVVDAAQMLMRNDVKGALDSFNTTGQMRVVDAAKDKPKDDSDHMWNVKTSDGRTIKFDAQKEYQAAVDPKFAMDAMRDERVAKRGEDKPIVIPAGASVLYKGKMVEVDKSPEWVAVHEKDADGNDRVVGFVNKTSRNAETRANALAGPGGPGIDPSAGFNRKDQATIDDIDKHAREKYGAEKIGEMGGTKWIHNDKSQAISSTAQSLWLGSSESGGRTTLDRTKAVTIAEDLASGKAKEVTFVLKDGSRVRGVDHNGTKYIYGGDKRNVNVPAGAAPSSAPQDSPFPGVPREAVEKVMQRMGPMPTDPAGRKAYIEKAPQVYERMIAPDYQPPKAGQVPVSFGGGNLPEQTAGIRGPAPVAVAGIPASDPILDRRVADFQRRAGLGGGSTIPVGGAGADVIASGIKAGAEGIASVASDAQTRFIKQRLASGNATSVELARARGMMQSNPELFTPEERAVIERRPSRIPVTQGVGIRP